MCVGLVVLAHSFDGRIYWFDARLDELLDPAPRKNRLRLRGVWSGHSSSITGLVRTAHGRALLSSTEAGEHSVWTRQKTRDSVMLMKQSEVHPPEKVQRAIVMDTGRLVMTLHEGYVILWDTSNSVAIEVDRCHYYLEGKVLSLLLLPEADDGISTYHIVAVTSKMRGVAWEVTVKETKSLHGANGVGGPKIRQYALFDLGETEEHHMLLAVDPVGWTATLTGSLDRFSREVATSISPTGLLRSWSARVSPATEEVNWLALWAVETGIKSASLIRGSSLGKVAIVSSERYDLTIWATRSAQLEYQMLFEKCDTVRDLDWACTPDSQSILAVGFTHKVVLLSQLRYDYLHKGPSWAPFREVKIQK